jgi:hypothetical protein
MMSLLQARDSVSFVCTLKFMLGTPLAGGPPYDSLPAVATKLAPNWLHDTIEPLANTFAALPLLVNLAMTIEAVSPHVSRTK